MYRSSLDGLTEQLRSLEEQKRRLEADLAGMKRIRWPQRAVRLAIAALAVTGTALAGGALGFRHAVIQLREVSQQDVRTAVWRSERCQERLTQALSLVPYSAEQDLAEEDRPPPTHPFDIGNPNTVGH